MQAHSRLGHKLLELVDVLVPLGALVEVVAEASRGLPNRPWVPGSLGLVGLGRRGSEGPALENPKPRIKKTLQNPL